MPTELSIAWSPIYHPEWDATPEDYVAAGLVGWGRSRRLARAEDAAVALKAYLGVQHFDPSQWNLPGEAAAKFFLSLRVHGRTLWLRTFPTMAAALAALRAVHASLHGEPGDLAP